MDFVFHAAVGKGSIDVPKSKPVSSFVPLLTMNANRLEASRYLNKARSDDDIASGQRQRLSADLSAVHVRES